MGKESAWKRFPTDIMLIILLKCQRKRTIGIRETDNLQERQRMWYWERIAIPVQHESRQSIMSLYGTKEESSAVP